MKKLLFLLTYLFISCNKTDVKTSDKNFLEIPYYTRINYTDSIAKKIIPNKSYQYWQYASYQQHYGSNREIYTIISQGGDTTFKRTFSNKINHSKARGLFEGGHPGFRSNYLMLTDGKKIRFVETMEQLRDFIGQIDNLEEALLFARSYDYALGSKLKAKSYNFSNDVYTLRLVKFNDSYPETLYRLRGDLVEVSITKNGFIKSRSLAVYCEGGKCFE